MPLDSRHIRNFVISALLLLIALPGFATDATLQHLEFADNELETRFPELHVLGGDLEFSAVITSSEPLQNPLFVTVFREQGGMPLPIVTRNVTASNIGAGQYRASYRFSLNESDTITRYRLAFWSTGGSDGQQKLDVGTALAVVYPTDYLEPLRRIASSRPFIMDGDAASPLLQSLTTLFDNWQIAYTSMPSRQISDAGNNAIFFSSNPALVDAGRLAQVDAFVLGSEMAPFPVLHRFPDSASILVPSSYLEGVANRLDQQVRLMEAIQLLEE